MRRRAFLTGALAAVGLAGFGGVGAVELLGGGPAGAADGSTSRTATTGATGTTGSSGSTGSTAAKTTKVTKRDLVQTEQIDGRLGYGDTRTIGGGPEGTITALPAEGTVLQQGDTLWEVDGLPGPALLFGARPMWRSLSSGVDKGEDVRQLEENLVALGYADPAVVTVDDSFTGATASAVKRWQKARGLEQTGRVEPADVVYAGAPLRVAEVKAHVGDKGGAQTEVMDVTGAEQVVTVHLDTSKAGVAKQDDPVTIKLSDDRTVDGTVRRVGTVVHSDTSQGQTSNYLDVVVALAGGQAVGLDDAPVTVNFVRSSAKGVLAVPVRALLALAEGGYAVERVTTTGTELVGVQLGASADGYVQITGNVAAGDTVVTA